MPPPRPGRTARARAREAVYVGYSPIIGVDADKIVERPARRPTSCNVVRNPWSAYADTKKRAVPLSLAHYMTGWSVHQLSALTFAAKYPGRVHVLRYEDIVADPVDAAPHVLAQGRSRHARPRSPQPSWNGKVLEQVYPWGTIRTPTPEANQATADELSAAETRGDPRPHRAAPQGIRLRRSPEVEAGFDPVLVTGAAGFIGAAAVRRLLAEGRDVHVLAAAAGRRVAARRRLSTACASTAST